MIKIFTLLFLVINLNAQGEKLTLTEALSILKRDNLEIKAAALDVKVAHEDINSVNGKNWGKLDFTQDFARSNDAGNVFGFKLTSREATFGDFGAEEFMDNLNAGQDPYVTPPQDLNYPDDRNFFQSKLRYEVPLFTGFALSSYSEMMHKVEKIKTLEKDEVVIAKEYELKKSYYDMALLDDSIHNLTKILNNIEILENVTQNMIDVGYAKKVDLLEVKAKKGNVVRLLGQMNANKELLYHYLSFLLNRKVSEIEVPSSAAILPNKSDSEILSQNIDIQKATTGLEVRRNMVSAQKARWYPTVGAFAEVATADNSFLGDASDHMAYTVGARLTWNIFNGGIDSSEIEKSKLQHLKMESQLALAKKGIALKLAKIKTGIKSANDEIASLEKELQLADAIYENYEGRYKEKLVSMSDVIIKQSAQIQKILQLQIAKNKRNEKILALEKLANGDIN